MKQQEGCPCKNCLCISVCREKSYTQMTEECDLLQRYLYITKERETIKVDKERRSYKKVIINTKYGKKKNYSDRVQKVVDIIKPHKWNFDKDLGIVIIIFREKLLTIKLKNE